MTTTRYIIFIVLVTSALILSGCKLSASTPPPASETPDSAMSTLEAELGNIATQTAVAGGGVESVPTQQTPGESTETTTTTDTAPQTSPENTQPPPQPTQTPVPVAPATPGVPQTYQLQKGEFPFCIARRFNVNQNELLSINGLTGSSVVPVGLKLNIPQTGNTFFGQRALLSHPTNYTVAGGDTIYTVACKYGDVDPNAIAQANNLSSPYALSAGQVIHIP
ncbi:MAG TPA: LysM peptidoglycan-binding domain-containing protein [Anaerolineales bacterium]|nr:LysM peptidoglycan-binding domain-containing protein [Anaerolineales bacterium]